MRIIYIIITSALLSTALLWLGRFGKLQRRTAAMLAAVSMLCSGVLLLLAVLPGNSFYGPVLTHGISGKKQIALTFDDGPYQPYTQKLLQVLAAKNVRATFFMVGENAARHPEIVRLVQSRGHQIALHAGYHQDLLKLSAPQLQENIAYGKRTLEQLTDQPVRYMRPPHGFKDWQVMHAMESAGLQAVNWSVIPRDWTNPGTEQIVSRVCSSAEPGAIVLLHDGDSPKQTAPREQTVAATAQIIDRLRADGYEFVTIEQLVK
ncbi:polysaccharide deacetylase family protein [uncultured Phascolarctobacterium sp.]|uniref:polysaccharide deacetylase family protein n=1 Tax=uncultured Phascolarctobacterium sp. TaxID=512296 RepID=UPI0025CEA6A2|nr:polysaccharide deacetylase family protein [uncultured Phascolarctobacterium sp.]